MTEEHLGLRPIGSSESYEVVGSNWLQFWKPSEVAHLPHIIIGAAFFRLELCERSLMGAESNWISGFEAAVSERISFADVW